MPSLGICQTIQVKTLIRIHEFSYPMKQSPDAPHAELQFQSSDIKHMIATLAGRRDENLKAVAGRSR